MKNGVPLGWVGERSQELSTITVVGSNCVDS